MLKTLQIKNFKGWKDTGIIELAPLTLFLGSNSSGKSSIGQSLILLKQSYLSADKKSTLLLSGQQVTIDFGLPTSILYQGNLENNLEFEYTWDLEENEKFSDILNLKEYKVNSVSFNSQISLPDKSKQVFEVEKMQYKLYNKSEMQFYIGMDRVQKASSARSYKVSSEKYDLKRIHGRVWEMPAPIKFYGFPQEMMTYHQNANDILKLNSLQEKLLYSISYLGPMRKPVERTYSWIGSNTTNVGDTGADTIAAILTAREEKRFINFKMRQQKKSLETILAQTMQDMGLIVEFKIEKISEERHDYDVKVRTKGSETFACIPDVGYGISQVLPVLVQIIYAPKDSIIIIEQPELHLHPSAQSALADALILAIKARENGVGRNIQLIIETHSEHLLRRLQLRIAENELSPELFKAYFANNDFTPAKLESLEVNSYGEVCNWPNNFFGDITSDIFKQTIAGIDRRQEELKK